MEFITAAKEIVIAVAASVGAYAAWAGVHAWKKQLRGTSEWDVGRRLMVSILELQSETLKVQSLIFWDSLTQSIYDDSYREFIRSLDDANIRGRQERLQLESSQLDEKQSSVSALKYEAEATLQNLKISKIEEAITRSEIARHAIFNMTLAYSYSALGSAAVRSISEYIADDYVDPKDGLPGERNAEQTIGIFRTAIDEIRSNLPR